MHIAMQPRRYIRNALLLVHRASAVCPIPLQLLDDEISDPRILSRTGVRPLRRYRDTHLRRTRPVCVGGLRRLRKKKYLRG